MESINTEVQHRTGHSPTATIADISRIVSDAISKALTTPTHSDRIDSDDPVMSAADDAEVKLLEDIKANGVQVVVTRDRRGNVRKTNMTGVAYDMIQRIKNNRRSGNNNVY